MLKRNPDAPVLFCEETDSEVCGACGHCGSATTSGVEHCSLECRLKASEAASSKRIAELEVRLGEATAWIDGKKAEELAAEEARRAVAERARHDREQAAYLGELAEAMRMRRYARTTERRLPVDYVRTQWERDRRLSHTFYGDVFADYDFLANCIPSRAAALSRQPAGHVRVTTESPSAAPKQYTKSDDEWLSWTLGLIVTVSGVLTISLLSF